MTGARKIRNTIQMFIGPEFVDWPVISEVIELEGARGASHEPNRRPYRTFQFSSGRAYLNQSEMS